VGRGNEKRLPMILGDEIVGQRYRAAID
jgi:hypothetical protein